MKVDQLLQLLKTAPPDAEIMLSSDAEGNKISPIDAASLEDEVCDEWDGERYKNVVVLWPT
jgi:hypothetical protein